MLKHKTIVLSISLLLLSSCQAKPEPEPEPEVTVDVAPVLSSAIQLKVKADATLYPLQQSAIVAKITAPVKKFYVEKGSVVRAGQLLAELENQDLAGTVAEAKAAYDQAEATYQTTARATVPEDLRKAELDVQTTKEAMDQQQQLSEGRQTLFQEGAIAQKDVNDTQVAFIQARNQHELARTHLEALRAVSQDQTLKGAAAQRDAAKARYESALAQLNYSKITSPISGIVTDRPLFAGEMPSGGGPIVTIMDLSQVIARAHVSQDEARVLKVGNMANLIPADGGAAIPGKVIIVSPALDPTSTTVEVWVQAANVANRLKPGSSLRVEAIAQSVPNALVIPEAAVLTSTSGSTSVIVASADNKPEKKSVTLGIHDNGNVQVTEGLVSGERVVTTGAFELNKMDPEVLAKTKLLIQPPKEEEEEDEK